MKSLPTRIATLLVGLTLVCSLSSSRAAPVRPVKPTIRGFYRAFVSAVGTVNPQTGRMSSAALGRLVAAQSKITDSATSIASPPSHQAAPHEVDLSREI